MISHVITHYQNKLSNLITPKILPISRPMGNPIIPLPSRQLIYPRPKTRTQPFVPNHYIIFIFDPLVFFLLNVPILSKSPRSHQPSHIVFLVLRFSTTGAGLPSATLSIPGLHISPFADLGPTTAMGSGTCFLTARLAMNPSIGLKGDLGSSPGTRLCSSGMTSSLGDVTTAF